jgi:hypothetical protein
MKSCEKCQWFEPFPPDDRGRQWSVECTAPVPASYLDGGLIERGDDGEWENYAPNCVFYAERSEGWQSESTTVCR